MARYGTPQDPSDTHDDESFELLQHLGTGGFAHTWKARVLEDDLQEEYGTDIVAMKIPLNKKKGRVLRREVELNALLFRTLKEMQACNLARYLGFETFRGQTVMIMEFVKSGNLRDRIGAIGRQKPMPIEEAVRIARGVLLGLAVIHQHHVFHRDIKPENILMDGDTPKISDLGIARMLESNELASTTTGTIYYMAPEILGEEGAAFSADIWSLGVTLYEMVTGRLPFGKEGTPIGTMVDLIRRGGLVPACEARREVPAALSKVIDRTLHKDPRKRFASAEDLSAALADLQRPHDPLEEELKAIGANPDPGAVEAKYKTFIAKHPGSPLGYQYLGELYNRCERHGEAIEMFQRGLTHAPEDAKLNFDLGMAFHCIKRAKDAERCLELAVKYGLEASYKRHAETILKVLKRKRT